MWDMVYKSDIGGFEYTVKRKRIKTLNLRIKRDGRVSVTAPFGVPEELIISFVEKNSEKVSAILKSFPVSVSNSPKKVYSAEDEQSFLKKAEKICRSIEPEFFEGEYDPPKIEICRGISRWGYCMPKKGIVRLNILLSEYPEECLRYVAIHEYCHFLVPNHSEEFYFELRKRMPDFKKWREMLKRKG